MRYAAYGSNLHPLRLRQRVPSADLRGAVVTPEWRLQFHKRGRDGSAKCNIVSADDSVLFAIFDMDENEKGLLDNAEGLNLGYEQISLSVPQYGDCFAYVASPSHIEANLRPYSWYKELVLAGLEYHRAPHDYLEAVRAVGHVTDNNRERHALNMAIVSRARSGD